MEGSGHSPGEGAQREGAAGSHPGCRLGAGWVGAGEDPSLGCPHREEVHM